MDIISVINSYVWVFSNLLLIYVAAIVVIFVILYRILFNVKATTGGKLIFRFMLSLVGIVALIVVGTFIDPAANRAWNVYPGDVAVWRPIVRFTIYAYVAYSITSLAVFLVIRRWFPHKVKTANDLQFIQPRRTASIPIIRDK